MKVPFARWGLWLFFMWLMAFVLSYHLLHFPFLANVATVIQFIIVDVVAIGLLLVLGGALGVSMLRRIDRFSLPEQTALQALVGLGAISPIVLTVGWMGLLPPTWLAWLLMLLALALVHRQALVWCRALKGVLLQLVDVCDDQALFIRWIRRGVLALLVLAGLMALAPPTEWDSLTYHLAGPKIFIEAGRVIGFPEMHYLGFPFLTEMLYTWLMILARPQAAVMLHGCFGLLMLLLVLGYAARLGRPAVGWLAAAILLGGGLLLEEFHWAYSDLSAVAYVFAALIVILTWRQSSEPHENRLLLLWGGVFAGMAMGTKYTVVGPVIGLGILVVWHARRDGLSGVLRAGGIVSGVALVVFSPWLIRNAILYQNPVAPFIWGTSAFDAIDHADYLGATTGHTDLISLLIVPLRGTIFGLLREGPGDIGGPLLVSLLPLAVVGWRQRPAGERQFVVSALIFAVPPYLLWIYGISISFSLSDIRLLFPLLPALALVAALGLNGLAEISPAPDIERLIHGIVSISLAITILAAARNILGSDALKVSLGLMSEGDYLTQTLPTYYEAMERINRELPEDALILFLWEPRVFYCHRHCVPDSLLNQWWHDLQVEPNPRQIAQRWRNQGITHVLIWDAGIQSLVSPEMKYEPLAAEHVAALEIVRREDLRLMWEIRLPVSEQDDLLVYSLYALKDTQR